MRYNFSEESFERRACKNLESAMGKNVRQKYLPRLEIGEQ